MAKEGSSFLWSWFFLFIGSLEFLWYSLIDKRIKNSYRCSGKVWRNTCKQYPYTSTNLLTKHTFCAPLESSSCWRFSNKQGRWHPHPLSSKNVSLERGWQTHSVQQRQSHSGPRNLTWCDKEFCDKYDE